MWWDVFECPFVCMTLFRLKESENAVNIAVSYAEYYLHLSPYCWPCKCRAKWLTARKEKATKEKTINSCWSTAKQHNLIWPFSACRLQRGGCYCLQCKQGRMLLCGRNMLRAYIPWLTLWMRKRLAASLMCCVSQAPVVHTRGRAFCGAATWGFWIEEARVPE